LTEFRSHEEGVEAPTRQLGEKTMFTRMTVLMRWKAWAACLAFILLTADAAKPAEQDTSAEYICAEREVLLETFLEAQGEMPNAGSPELAERSILIVQARAACRDGRLDDALVAYDRLIAKLQSVVTYRGQREYGAGDGSRW
jgi:hypothetical protein